MPQPALARQVSYAASAGSRPARALVRAMENAGGRIALIRRAQGYEAELARGRDFWEVMCDRYGVRIRVVGGSLDAIPRDGPLVVVANHPYGILDGLALGRILSMRRPGGGSGGFRIMAHSVFERAPELGPVLLPVRFDVGREAVVSNLAMRAEALRHLGEDGAIGIFPGGTVSTAPTPFGPALDPTWRSFTAKLAQRPGTTVVPVFFEGANSRLFQVASHLHHALRLGLLIPEFRRRVDGEVRVAVGEAVPREAIEAWGADARGLMADLRGRTYALSPRPLPAHRLGHEFEARYRRPERRGAGRRPGAGPPLAGCR